MKKFVVGVFGAGRIGQVHMNAMQNNPQVEIRRVVDVMMDSRMESQVRKFGVKEVSTEAKDIFNDKDINAVFICSITSTHTPYSLEAIRTHKHIFCEKPVDQDIKNILTVQKALKKSPLVYQVGFNRRFDHNFMAIKHAVDTKKIGKPQMISIISRDPAPPPIDYIKNSGGLFMDMMIHDFDMARFQSGSEVEEVYAMGSVLVDKAIGKAGDIDSAIVTLRFKNGMIGVIENCRQARYGYDQRLEVLGDKGAVKMENDTPSTLVLSNTSGVSRENPLHFFLERYKDAYILEQQCFFNAIAKKKESPCGIGDGLESVRIAYAAMKSLQEHRPVALREIKG